MKTLLLTGISRNDLFSWVYGFFLTIGLVMLGLIIGLGNVRSETSYGLLPVIGILGTLAGGWSQTRFKTTTELNGSRKPPTPVESAAAFEKKAEDLAK